MRFGALFGQSKVEKFLFFPSADSDDQFFSIFFCSNGR